MQKIEGVLYGENARTDNLRFGAMGAEVIAQTLVKRFTVRDCPRCSGVTSPTAPSRRIVTCKAGKCVRTGQIKSQK